jgi:BirA family biotin operon repressor/biotin-[acetyl-CoA-carboxylase] ligase
MRPGADDGAGAAPAGGRPRWRRLRGAGVSDRNADPAGTPGRRAGLGFRRGDRLEARRQPGFGLAPDGEAARPGLRVRGAARAGLPAVQAAEDAARRARRGAAQGPQEGVHLRVLDEVDSTNDEAPASSRPGARRPSPSSPGGRPAAGGASAGSGTARRTATSTRASRSARGSRPSGCRPSRSGWASRSASSSPSSSPWRPASSGRTTSSSTAGRPGGMLTEARVDADQIRDLVFGLGLNVNSPPADWPSELAAARGLALRAGRRPGRPEPAHGGAHRAGPPGLRAVHRRRARRHVRRALEPLRRPRGREVTLAEGGRKRRGRVLGVDDVGSLLLRDEHGAPAASARAR